MHCEIEFLPVGEGEKAGDAIVLRYGYQTNYRLMLVDGGHEATGEEIVAHLRQEFGSSPVLEHVVLTHSDADHASGLRTIIREIPVANLWLHIPWLLAEESRHLFSYPWTAEGLRDAVKREYDIIGEIVDLARAAGCKLHFPFRGDQIGPFLVCSPSRWSYNYLLPQFDKTPEPDQAAIEAAGMWLGKESLAKKLYETAKAKLQNWTRETWDRERLRDGGITSASNESSVVLYGEFDNDDRVLLTGDAGVNGLHWAADFIQSQGFPLQQFSFVQIPHHGSRRNVGPTILTHILGDKQAEADPPRFAAFVSAPADDAQHPRRIVLNAFKRRGGRIIATQGGKKVHWGGFPVRPSYIDADELPFYTTVEEYT
jgi:beta-lactamase superfamily II metal-dependent hydrolase